MKPLAKAKLRDARILRRLGIIDLGTNSVRYDVHEIHPRGGTQLLHREKLMVRLGESVFVTGKLHRNAVRRDPAGLFQFPAHRFRFASRKNRRLWHKRPEGSLGFR